MSQEDSPRVAAGSVDPPLESNLVLYHGALAPHARWRALVATSGCETHRIDPVFMWGADLRTRPTVAICLTALEHAGDGGGVARPGSTRGYAAHAVRTLRPTGLTGGAMLRRPYTQRSLVEVLLPRYGQALGPHAPPDRYAARR